MANLGNSGAGTTSTAAKNGGGQAYLIGGLLLLAFLPSLISYGSHLWQRPHFQFFPLALAGAGYLAWRALTERGQISGSGSGGTMFGLLLIALGALIFATFMGSPWLGAVAAFLAVLAFIFGAGGWSLLFSMGPAITLVLVLICLPLDWDSAFVFGLRRFAVQTSGYLLDSLHVPYFLSGNVVEIRDHKLFVDEACSGINSAFFIMALSLFYGFWRKLSKRRVIFITAASVSFVLLGNVLRISGGALLIYRWGIDTLSGKSHEIAGLIFYAAYVGLIFSTDKLISALFDQGEYRRSFGAFTGNEIQPAVSTSPDLRLILGEALNRLSAKWVWPFTIIFLCLGLLQAGWAVTGRHALALPQAVLRGAPRLKANSTFDLPATIAGWQRLEKDQYDASIQERVLEDQKILSHSWAYRNGPVIVLVSLDYPYKDYHDLTTCYIGVGWQITETKYDSSSTGASFSEVNMRKKPFSNGFLLYGAFLSDGRWFDGLTGQLRARFGERITPVYQVQSLVSSVTPLTAEQKRQVREVFEEARKRLVAQVVAQTERKP